MTDEVPVVDQNPAAVIERIKMMGMANTEAPVSPGSIAQLIQLFINVEPKLLPVIAALFPNNQLIQQAVNLLPTLLPLLQELEALLTALGL